ncbi:MAG: sulfatase [Bacteroidetes bacterium]|nr:sulfatase [Bacteroidota bacterium]
MTNLCKALAFVLLTLTLQAKSQSKKPNILFCIADDASWIHMSAYGKTDWVSTPAFDQVAKSGVLFTNAYTPNSKCSPSRACILTGRNPWQLEEAGNHNAFFPAKFTTFIESLGSNGYQVGFTGKGWSPGDPGKINGKNRQLTGPSYDSKTLKAPTTQISATDYAGNFEDFLAKKPADKPFCFWYGGNEPHRDYEYGTGVKVGNKRTSEIDQVPPHWMDNEVVRNDMLDYAFEVEYFDKQLGKILEVLKAKGELENTIIVVTSDNGMPFPRTKGYVYEHANHLPLAIMWKNGIKSTGRKVSDYVSFIDFAPTFLEAAGVEQDRSNMQPVTGKSLLPLLKSTKSGRIDPSRNYVLLGKERTDVGRPDDVGYPIRAIVKDNFIYAINFEPERWPAGNPETGYMDTDGSPTKTELLTANRKGQYTDLWQLNFGKKGKDELFDIAADPYSLKNLTADNRFASKKDNLKTELLTKLKQQNDPRMFGKGDVFDKYPYNAENVRNYYNRYIYKNETIKAGWIDKTDYEPKPQNK